MRVRKAPRSQQVMLPNRKALAQLTKGDPTQQSLGNYAKLTPSGPAGSYSDIIHEGEMGPQVVPALPPGPNQ